MNNSEIDKDENGKKDARSWTKEERIQARQQIGIALEISKGNKSKAARILGVSRPTIDNWVKMYSREDCDLKARFAEKKRGKPETKYLTDDQYLNIRQEILYSLPDEIGLSFSLWSNNAIRDFCKREYKVDLPLYFINRLLRKWGYIPENTDYKQIFQYAPYPHGNSSAITFLDMAKKYKARSYYINIKGISLYYYSIYALTSKGYITFRILSEKRSPCFGDEINDFLAKLKNQSSRRMIAFYCLDNVDKSVERGYCPQSCGFSDGIWTIEVD